jgi:hypothetical protein
MYPTRPRLLRSSLAYLTLVGQVGQMIAAVTGIARALLWAAVATHRHLMTITMTVAALRAATVLAVMTTAVALLRRVNSTMLVIGMDVRLLPGFANNFSAPRPRYDADPYESRGPPPRRYDDPYMNGHGRPPYEARPPSPRGASGRPRSPAGRPPYEGDYPPRGRY